MKALVKKATKASKLKTMAKVVKSSSSKGSAKGSLASAISKTPTGKLFSSTKKVGYNLKNDSPSNSKESGSDSIQRGDATGLRISKQTLEVLHNIDNDLKDVLTALTGQKQREEAAAEEAKDEAAAVPVGPGGDDAQQKQSTSGGSIISKLGAKLAGFAMSLAVMAMPILDLLKVGFKTLMDVSDTIGNLFSKYITPIFTEKLPELFTKEIPEVFTVKLPGVFKDGTDFVKEKFSNILGGLGDILTGMKSTIGNLITGIADNPVLKFLLPESVITSIKKFGSEMTSPVSTTAPEAKAIATTDNKATKIKSDNIVSAVISKNTNGTPSTIKPIGKTAIAVANDKKGKDASAASLPPAVSTMPKTISNLLLDTEEAVNNKIQEEQNTLVQLEKEKSSKDLEGDTKESSKLQLQIDLTKKNLDTLNKTKRKIAAANMTAPDVTKVATLDSSDSILKSKRSAIPAPVSNPISGSAGASVASTPSTASITGGSTSASPAAPVSSEGSGSSVAAASMAATAPEPTMASVDKNISKSNPTLKKNPGLVNPIGNVPDVTPNLGTIANLWYHNATA